MVACGEGIGSGNVPGQRDHEMLVYKEETPTVTMMVSGGGEIKSCQGNGRGGK